MIFVRDKGRMCNNILQYGHLYAWGREHGRTTMSMRFAYKYPYFHICNTPHHNFFCYCLGKYAAKAGLIATVSFDSPEADTAALEQQLMAHRHVMAQGWYARFYDLFLKYKADILTLFAFHADIEAAAARRLQGSEGCIRLGVHIRRGDYATWQGGRYLFTDEQYIAVISRFVALHPASSVRIYICGNDPKLDHAKFLAAFGQGNVVFPDGNPGQDLCLLSHCNYLIGAPSTFSLVASMYRDTPLYWIKDAEAPLRESSFGRFEELFRQII